jgi:hypothetical protein
MNILNNGAPKAKNGDTVNSMGKWEQAFSKVRTAENQHNYLENQLILSRDRETIDGA